MWEFPPRSKGFLGNRLERSPPDRQKRGGVEALVAAGVGWHAKGWGRPKLGRSWAHGSTECSSFHLPFRRYGCGSKPMPSLVHFSGDWDVRWGHGMLTHGHTFVPLLVLKLESMSLDILVLPMFSRRKSE